MQNVSSSYSMCCLSIIIIMTCKEFVLLLQNVFSSYRMHPPITACVVFLSSLPSSRHERNLFSYYRMCSLIAECVLFLLLQHVLSFYHHHHDMKGMCSLITECVLFLLLQRQRYATACCAYRPTFIRCLSINPPPPPPPPPHHHHHHHHQDMRALITNCPG